VRPVNLLPERYRPRKAGSGDSRTPYFALGGLALLVLAVFGYVMTANQVVSRNSEIAQARQQIAAAQTQAVTFKDYGDFAAIKQQRLAAVQELATARMDWERTFRELAHVLPAGVWLTGFDGRVAAASSTEGGGSTDGLGQTLSLAGCAESHKQIADVLVRLRELHVAEDVELTQTLRQTEEGGTTSSTAGGGSDSDCGEFYAFEIDVTLALAAPVADAEQPVPARLGGGG
jgi:Tfp pilus assembly protein PilN